MGGDDIFVLILCLVFLGVTAWLLRGTRGVPDTGADEGTDPAAATRRRVHREPRS